MLIVLLTGCHFLGIANQSNDTIYATFSMTDTTGKATTVFHSGESFDLSFSMKNTTKDTLIYGWAPPMVSFEIIGNDSTVSYSYEGCPVPNYIVTAAEWAPGKSITESWKAPTSPCMQHKVILAPGSYVAKVHYPNIKNRKVTVSSPIKFTVVQ